MDPRIGCAPRNSRVSIHTRTDIDRFEERVSEIDPERATWRERCELSDIAATAWRRSAEAKQAGYPAYAARLIRLSNAAATAYRKACR